MNFQPCKWARTAMSMSSTVVLSIHPPDSSKAFILQTPAVPLNPKKLRKMPLTCCSTSKWKAKFMSCSLVSKFSSLLTNDHLAWTSPMWNSPLKEIWVGLEISVENGDKLVILNITTIHGRFKVAGFITLSNHSMPVNYVGTIFLPLVHFILN
ncbi:1-deoxy-D-xylulose-5-phosphate synthase [Striga asiatica]|uniref:1-deoxy-D-xylulose-5-phosphate synthase n=1 Tax=Striga asiatica TaxID=4170 RepID=A0A5A7PEC7_STRAF|nr:1-deoxy-D-xylulose-5-phosphate synthase [Striga asiatica]